MTSRRNFLGASIVAGLSLSMPKSLRSLSSFPNRAAIWAPLLEPNKDEILITVLHTNDTHSQIDPILDNDKTYPGKGRCGAARNSGQADPQRKPEHAVD